jgi:hypothetical protein
MKVFKYWGPPDPYARFMTGASEKNAGVWEDGLLGEPRSADWEPIEIVPAEEDPDVPLPLGPIADITTVNAAIRNCVWSPRARAALEPHVGQCGEFLRLRCKEADWVLFHVTRIIDALDENASEIVYFPGPQRKVLRLVKVVFKPRMLEGELMFRIPQRSSADVFVTERFVQLVEQHGLVGFNLKQVWDSESDKAERA